MTRMSLSALIRLAVPSLALALAISAGAASPTFYPDDPISLIEDSQDASEVKERDIDLIFDTFENSFHWPGDRTPDVRAQNLNTIDEVPDSSWFTNRLGTRDIAIDELLEGPDTSAGPRSGSWTVVAAKNDGVSPGFTVEDSARQVWFIKFDPPGYRAMATGTEVVVAKLFWALGYHVPEVHIASLRPDQLTIGEGARVTTPNGTRRPFKQSDIQALLAKAHREPDGTYRVIASKALEGRPVGGFLFYGRRADDPNDIVAHEHRRELRAVRNVRSLVEPRRFEVDQHAGHRDRSGWEAGRPPPLAGLRLHDWQRGRLSARGLRGVGCTSSKARRHWPGCRRSGSTSRTGGPSRCTGHGPWAPSPVTIRSGIQRSGSRAMRIQHFGPRVSTTSSGRPVVCGASLTRC